MLSSHYIYQTQVTKVNSVPIDEFVSDWVINGRLNLFVFETRIKHPNRVVLLAIMWLNSQSSDVVYLFHVTHFTDLDNPSKYHPISFGE